jgi:hypothetical protein
MGGIAGAGLGLGLCSFGDERTPAWPCARGTVITTAIGVVLGAGVGAMIGSLVPREPVPAER